MSSDDTKFKTATGVLVRCHLGIQALCDYVKPLQFLTVEKLEHIFELPPPQHQPLYQGIVVPALWTALSTGADLPSAFAGAMQQHWLGRRQLELRDQAVFAQWIRDLMAARYTEGANLVIQPYKPATVDDAIAISSDSDDDAKDSPSLGEQYSKVYDDVDDGGVSAPPSSPVVRPQTPPVRSVEEQDKQDQMDEKDSRFQHLNLGLGAPVVDDEPAAASQPVLSEIDRVHAAIQDADHKAEPMQEEVNVPVAAEVSPHGGRGKMGPRSALVEPKAQEKRMKKRLKVDSLPVARSTRSQDVHKTRSGVSYSASPSRSRLPIVAGMGLT
jgi:hypothetical protein